MKNQPSNLPSIAHKSDRAYVLVIQCLLTSKYNDVRYYLTYGHGDGCYIKTEVTAKWQPRQNGDRGHRHHTREPSGTCLRHTRDWSCQLQLLT